MTLEVLLNLVENHSLSLVLLFLFLIWFKPKLNQLWDIAINGRKDKIENFKNSFSNSIERTLKINNLLNQLLADTNSDRAYIFEFHNGGHNIAGVDFAKCSNTYEVVSKKISPQQKNLQNLPIGMIIPFLKEITTKDSVNFITINDLKEMGDYGSYETLKAQGIYSLYVKGIKDEQGRYIGFLGVDYCCKDKAITHEGIKSVNELAYKLSILLNEDVYNN